jgi:hypothetical protein
MQVWQACQPWRIRHAQREDIDWLQPGAATRAKRLQLIATWRISFINLDEEKLLTIAYAA